MRFRFTIRELLWLAVVVALAVGWWLEGHNAAAQRTRDRHWISQLESELNQLRVPSDTQLYFHPFIEVPSAGPPPAKP